MTYTSQTDGVTYFGYRDGDLGYRGFSGGDIRFGGRPMVGTNPEDTTNALSGTGSVRIDQFYMAGLGVWSGGHVSNADMRWLYMGFDGGVSNILPTDLGDGAVEYESDASLNPTWQMPAVDFWLRFMLEPARETGRTRLRMRWTLTNSTGSSQTIGLAVAIDTRYTRMAYGGTTYTATKKITNPAQDQPVKLIPNTGSKWYYVGWDGNEAPDAVKLAPFSSVGGAWKNFDTDADGDSLGGDAVLLWRWPATSMSNGATRVFELVVADYPAVFRVAGVKLT